MPDTTKMLFTMSEKQKNEVKEQAGMIGVTTSELFRWKMFYPSPSDTAALYETKASIMRMENRLKEAIHLQTDFAVKLGQGSDEDRNIQKKLQEAENEIREIHKELEEIDETCSRLFEEIKTSDLIALKKIHDGDGDQSSDGSQGSLPGKEDDQEKGFEHYNPEWEETWGNDF